MHVSIQDKISLLNVFVFNLTIRVILVHSHEFVVDKMSAPFPSLATEALKKLGVEVKLNSRVKGNNESEVYLENGESIPCDLFIPTNPSGNSHELEV